MEPSPVPPPPVATHNGVRAPLAADLRKHLGLDRGARIRARAWQLAKYLALAAVAAAIAAVVWRARRPPPAPTYVVAAVTRGELRVAVVATGRVEATTVDVGAEVSGRIVELPVDVNAKVTRGQLLAVIDREQLQAAVTQAQAQVAAAQATVRQAKATAVEAAQSAARTAELAGQALVTTQSVEANAATRARAVAAHEVAVANARLATAGLAAARAKLDKATILSPIDGVVLARQVEPGQTVTAGFTTPVLFTLAADLTKMTLTIDVDEADVGRVHEGDPATFTVDAYVGRSFPSRVVRLSNQPTIAQNVVTYEARLEVANPDGALRPGMTATATVITEVRSDVVLVPNAALRFTPPTVRAPPLEAKAGTGRVWLAPARAGAAPTAAVVQLGASDGLQTEIVTGLPAGASVLVDVEGGR